LVVIKYKYHLSFMVLSTKKMDLKDCPKYKDQYRRYDRHHCYCKKCGEELYPYCIKHNNPIKSSYPMIISCGILLCRQKDLSFYLPSQGCKYCSYGQSEHCDRKDCVQLKVQYPKGCTYCRYPSQNGIQIFKCETPNEESSEDCEDVFELNDDIKKCLIELYNELVDD